jgi:hypothetical protein
MSRQVVTECPEEVRVELNGVIVRYRPIVGYVGYRAGDDGSIWSCWALQGRGLGNGTMGCRYVTSDRRRQLKGGRIHHYGHRHVTLNAQCKSVHRLILTTFVGPRPKGMVCRHLDGNPGNNALSNLRWGTPKENAADSIAHGTRAAGERNGSAKLTAEQVRKCRVEYAAGTTSQAELAKRYGVDPSAVSNAIRRRNWRALK